MELFTSNITLEAKDSPIDGVSLIGTVHLPSQITAPGYFEQALIDPNEKRPLKGMVTTAGNAPLEALKVSFCREASYARLYDWFLVLDKEAPLTTDSLIYFSMEDGPFKGDVPNVGHLESFAIEPSRISEYDLPSVSLRLSLFGENGEPPKEQESLGKAASLQAGVETLDKVHGTLLVACLKKLTTEQTLAADEFALHILVENYLADPSGVKNSFSSRGSKKELQGLLYLLVEQSAGLRGEINLDPELLRKELTKKPERLELAKKASEAFGYLCELLATDPDRATNLIDEHAQSEDTRYVNFYDRVINHKRRAGSHLKLV